jgi:hypothetical protein
MILNPYRFAGGGGYIVDDHSPEAAYSLREVASAYVDVDIVEVKRSSDSALSYFTATEITDGTLTTWVGAGNDGRVVTLVDQTGGGNDLVSSVGIVEPRIVISGSLVTDGGLPAMDYAGATEDSVQLRTDVANSWLAGSDFSVFCVANANSATRTQYIWANSLGVTGQKRSLIGISSNQLNMVFWGTNVNLGSWTAGNQSLTSTIGTNMLTGESHNVDLWVDGSAQTGWSGTGKTTPASSPFVLGERSAGTGANQDFDGKIAECIVFASDQTSNRSAIDSNITTHYGL